MDISAATRKREPPSWRDRGPPQRAETLRQTNSPAPRQVSVFRPRDAIMLSSARFFGQD